VPWTDQPGAQCEGVRHTDGLDRHVGAQPTGQLHHPGYRVVLAVVHQDVRAELLGRVKAVRSHLGAEPHAAHLPAPTQLPISAPIDEVRVA
jgi:hypothetical protein